MINTDSILRFLIATVLSLFLLRCSPTEVVEGGPDHGGGSEVWAKLVDSDNTPVAGAKVAAYDTADTSNLPAAEEFTNTEGIFTFDSTELDPGTYDFVATTEDTSLVVVIEAKAHDDDSLGTFTMLPPGTISGKVQVVGSSVYDNVKCYIPGTSYQATPDEAGEFTVSNIPPGTYSLVCFKTGYIRNKTEDIPVRSGEDTRIPAVTLNPDTTGRPLPPRDVRAFYETTSGEVRLSWDSSYSPDIYGYYVYRGESPPYELVTHSAVEGLSYVYDGLEPGLTESELLAVRFLVAAVDGDGNISENAPAAMQSSFSVVIDSAHQIITQGSGIHCRLTVQRPAGEFSVQLSSRGPGSDTSWFSPMVADNTVDTLLPTGDASSWDSVLIRVEAPGAGTIDTAILVDIRPEPVTLRIADSTTSSITVSWNQPAEISDFELYLLQITRHDSTQLVTISDRNIVEYEYAHLQNGPIYFSAAVRDSEGLIGAWSDTISGSIINSPPQFANGVGAFKDTITAGRPWSHTFSAADPNGDSMSFTLLNTDLFGLKNDGPFLRWDSTFFGDTGTFTPRLVAEDSFGAADTMRLFLEVVIRDTSVVDSSAITPVLVKWSTLTAVGNRLYLVGGRKPGLFGGWSTIPDVHILNPQNGTWYQDAYPMTTARMKPASVISDESIYIIGGSDWEDQPLSSVEILNTVSGEWNPAPPLPYPVFGAAACVYNETIFLFGGKTSDPTPSDKVLVLAPGAEQWVEHGTLASPRMHHGAVEVGGRILIAGGSDGATPSRECEWYDPVTGGSTTGPNLLMGRKSLALVSIGRKAYALGGSTTHSRIVNSVEVLDLSKSTPQWENGRPLLQKRSSHSAAVHDGRIYIAGGTQADREKPDAEPTEFVEVYYP